MQRTFGRAQRAFEKFLGDEDWVWIERWSRSDALTSGEQIRRAAHRHSVGCRAPALFALLARSAWPARSARAIHSSVRRRGECCAQLRGVSPDEQRAAQRALAATYGMAPDAYYHYELHRPERAAQAGDYLSQAELRLLMQILNHGRRHPAIDDKLQFAAVCADAGLATAPVLATARAGHVEWRSEQDGDLFIKPVTGLRGEGAFRRTAAPPHRRTAQTYFTDERHAVDRAELDVWLAQRTSTRPLLVQPRLANHPDIADMAIDALATVRIVTGAAPGAPAELIAATFKTALRPGPTNTVGLCSAVDPASGVLSPACTYRPIDSFFAAHPTTGAQIAGRSLPDWAAAVELARRAHDQFPMYPFLGWDVALTPDGPLLLEGNSGWDVVTVQKPQRTLLLQGRFIEICAAWTKAPHNLRLGYMPQRRWFFTAAALQPMPEND